jgi:hypothetical protein
MGIYFVATIIGERWMLLRAMSSERRVLRAVRRLSLSGRENRSNPKEIYII